MVGLECMDVLLGALWVGKDILREVIAEERERTPVLCGCVQFLSMFIALWDPQV